MPQLGPWDGLTGLTLAGPSLYRHTQPLHRPRASSHYPRTRPQRPYPYKCALRPSGAASIALRPPRPQGRSVLPPQRTLASTAVWSAWCAFVRHTFLGRSRGQPATHARGMQASGAARQRAQRGWVGVYARAHLQAQRAHRERVVADAESSVYSASTAVEILKKEVSSNTPDVLGALQTRTDARESMRHAQSAVVRPVLPRRQLAESAPGK